MTLRHPVFGFDITWKTESGVMWKTESTFQVEKRVCFPPGSDIMWKTESGEDTIIRRPHHVNQTPNICGSDIMWKTESGVRWKTEFGVCFPHIFGV